MNTFSVAPPLMERSYYSIPNGILTARTKWYWGLWTLDVMHLVAMAQVVEHWQLKSEVPRFNPLWLLVFHKLFKNTCMPEPFSSCTCMFSHASTCTCTHFNMVAASDTSCGVRMFDCLYVCLVVLFLNSCWQMMSSVSSGWDRCVPSCSPSEGRAEQHSYWHWKRTKGTCR